MKQPMAEINIETHKSMIKICVAQLQGRAQFLNI